MTVVKEKVPHNPCFRALSSSPPLSMGYLYLPSTLYLLSSGLPVPSSLHSSQYTEITHLPVCLHYSGYIPPGPGNCGCYSLPEQLKMNFTDLK